MFSEVADELRAPEKKRSCHLLTTPNAVDPLYVNSALQTRMEDVTQLHRRLRKVSTECQVRPFTTVCISVLRLATIPDYNTTWRHQRLALDRENLHWKRNKWVSGLFYDESQFTASKS